VNVKKFLTIRYLPTGLVYPEFILKNTNMNLVYEDVLVNVA